MRQTPSLMRYEEIPPPAPLAPWVAAFWVFEVAAAAGEIQHPIPLTGGVIVALLPGSEPVLTGPRVHPLVVPVHGGEIHYGVHLLPGAVESLIGIPAAVLRDQAGPARLWIDEAVCASFRTAADPAGHLVNVLSALAARAAEPDAVVMSAVRAILATDGAASIAELARASGLSPRHFRRRFTALVGLSPKELARLRRLRASAAAAVVEGRSWADAANEHGFADQAHLVREFRSLLGHAPREFRAHAGRIAHRLLS
jgi:AraC-like DNA-binding protein